MPFVVLNNQRNHYPQVVTHRIRNIALMTPFLQSVANDLVERFGNDLSRLTLVFPNKRAGLFFNDYLQRSDRPMWAPQQCSISELLCSLSDLDEVDEIEAVCRLYNIYMRLTGADETLDRFFGWGQRLLADFDDVDKNLCNAQLLFVNVRDYHRIDQFADFLTEEQKRILRRYSVDFREGERTQLRENFFKVWDNLLAIYNDFNAELAADGLAYQGALYRRTVERIVAGEAALPDDVAYYVFVGFNVLDKVEHKFFSYLQREGRAHFYWDYDVFYTSADSPYEAGRFLRDNLKDFPSPLPPTLFNNMNREKQIEIVSAPTESAQAFSTAPWLREHLTREDEKQTAVVLLNEDLVEPVLHALPPEVQGLNVTMGFPLSHTHAFSFLHRKLKHVSAKSTKESNAKFLRDLSEQLREDARLKDAAARQDEAGSDDAVLPLMRQLHAEAYFQCYTVLNRFIRLVESGLLSVEPLTLQRLVLGVVRRGSVPFHGEPAAGLQVMGLLETRCLDFRRILLLSCSENFLPRTSSEHSFIPYPLRRAYGLTLVEKKTAVFAYYFFRLLSRAEHVTLMYNTTSTDARASERSRFLTQLLLAPELRVVQKAFSSPQQIAALRPLRIDKPANLIEQLTDPEHPLSPSSINSYRRCSLQFFYKRICHLHTPEAETDELQNNTFGTIFHRAAELFYTEVPDAEGRVSPDVLRSFLGDKPQRSLERYVVRAFNDVEVEMNDVAALSATEYLRNLISHDLKLPELRIVKLEQKFSVDIPVMAAGRTVTFRVGGTVDRLDSFVNPLTGRLCLRVLDYKTGKEAKRNDKPARYNSIVELFADRSETESAAQLQTLLYTMAVKRRAAEFVPVGTDVTSAVFHLPSAAKEDYSPWLWLGGEIITHFTDEIEEEFQRQLQQLLSDIVDPEFPFAAVLDENKRCRHCDYRILCGLKSETCTKR